MLCSAFKMALKDPISCYSHPFIAPFHTVPALLCAASKIWQKWKYVTSRLDYKRPCGFHLGSFSLSDLVLWEEPTAMVWEAHTEEVRLLPTTMWVNLEVDLPAPVKPLDDYSPRRWPSCNLMRDPELGLPRKTTPRVLTLRIVWDNTCWFSLATNFWDNFLRNSR